jgi:hypothetical protein
MEEQCIILLAEWLGHPCEMQICVVLVKCAQLMMASKAG